ncbi:MAG TPA: hypothetical protein ENN05_12250 [Deltaproteobacteria bacterium]|nr:hypothetical protein [Deltaproteobacteria bacterium]
MMKRVLLYSITLLMMVVFIPGCAELKENFQGSTSTPSVKPSPRYFDFNDVLVPGGLNKDTKESYITNAHGRLVLSGRLESGSLAQFFITSMYSDGWTALNQYEYQGSIKLFFKKSERIASILITENPLGTRVEIWVIPQGKI